MQHREAGRTSVLVVGLDLALLDIVKKALKDLMTALLADNGLLLPWLLLEAVGELRVALEDAATQTIGEEVGRKVGRDGLTAAIALADLRVAREVFERRRRIKLGVARVGVR